MPSGTACQQAGIGTLQSLGLLELHRTNPALFQTGGVSVVVPGLGTVPATWCNGV